MHCLGAFYTQARKTPVSRHRLCRVKVLSIRRLRSPLCLAQEGAFYPRQGACLHPSPVNPYAQAQMPFYTQAQVLRNGDCQSSIRFTSSIKLICEKFQLMCIQQHAALPIKCARINVRLYVLVRM